MQRRTCLDVAKERVSQRAIKPSTIKEYLGTIRALGLADVPFDEVTVALANARLQTILNPGTRRKHTINLRAALGLKLPCPKALKKIYDLPETDVLEDAMKDSIYYPWGAVMLHAGLRLGEACTNQRLLRNVLYVDRQRLANGTITTSKTSGPVYVSDWLAELIDKTDFSRSPNTVYVGIRRAGKRAGLTINPHMLRHAYATNLIKKGMPAPLLQQQMRHRDVSVTLAYYYQFRDEDILSYLS